MLSKQLSALDLIETYVEKGPKKKIWFLEKRHAVSHHRNPKSFNTFSTVEGDNEKILLAHLLLFFLPVRHVSF